jgi:hypothetical protein
MTAIVRRRAALAAFALALASASVQAGETRLAVGALTFAPGLDLHLTWRAEESHWQLGLRAVRFSDEFQFYGESLTETTTTMAGPTLNYLFTPHSRGSWYLGTSLLYWGQREKSLRTGTIAEDSALAPFFGAGYTGRLGKTGFYNMGLFVSPVELTTETADSMTTGNGADVQLQLGIAF